MENLMNKIFYFPLLLLLSSIAAAQSPVPAGAVARRISTGFIQPEGPVWKDGVLLFSDIAASKIYQWSPVDSLSTVYLHPSDSSNGLTLDLQGRLILTQMQHRRVSRQESNGTITPLASTFRGKKFNSPNDVVVKSDGAIFFTDPDFNIPAGQPKELAFKGVYRIGPSGNITLLDSTFDKPNGICFSPDESKLYVNESPLGKIYVWDVVNDSTIANKDLLYTVPVSGYVDGMKTDSAGNIYCTGPTGVWIVSDSGTYLDKIAIPQNPSNCNWGDADRKTLFITAGSSLYSIRLSTTTGIEHHGSIIPGKYDLDPNFPNPFNPSTTIHYQIPVRDHVSLKVYDMLGRDVATLIDEYQNPGEYSCQFSSENNRLSSGIYIYRMIAGSFIQSNKMILLK